MSRRLLRKLTARRAPLTVPPALPARQSTWPIVQPCGCPSAFIHSHGCTKFAAERARVAAEQEHPRLRIWKLFSWQWQVTGPDAEILDSGACYTHAEALAVGLAALEVASLAGSTP